MSEHADVVVVIGGGQAGLAAGYYLRRAGLDFVILDGQARAGGAWRHGWDSLRLFSSAEYSPLPGWPMPRQRGETFPTAGHVVEYLHDYEQRYELPVHRPVQVSGVRAHDRGLSVETDHDTWNAAFVISATGTWDTPFVPAYPGMADFKGEQLHTVDYSTPEQFRGQRVLIVGAGNSAAQIVAEVSAAAETTWTTRHPPRFMPDNVDGRVLFDTATREEAARKAGTQAEGVSGLGDIVMVPSVRAARDRGVLRPRPMFDRLTPEGAAWNDGTAEPYDAIIWCTGFRPTLGHLAPLGLSREKGLPKTIGTRSADEPRLHLLGYGDWTGFASATLMGAGRAAKDAIRDITSHPPAASPPQ
ncbi:MULTISPECIES: ArsO family NAD(P)H-dependent flavin-containing monooxygenase [Microbacteriaceae]|uniref:ArsO family NAD(P)H-dependent flavin-containing monooxygenase n=1 Tax=Microbacteriaceae TaxID=85023 RepID=UPI00341E8CF3